jgi:hypothetical protein
MKVRFVFSAFVLGGLVATAAVGGALWMVALSYDDLGDALEQRNRQLQASAELMKLIQPAARVEAEAESTHAVALQKQWIDSGALEDELTVLRETLEARLQPEPVTVAAVRGLDPSKREFAGAASSQADRALKQSYGADAVSREARLVSDANRLIEIANARTNRALHDAVQRLGHAIGIALGAAALMVLLTIAAAIVLRTSIMRPIGRLARGVEQVPEPKGRGLLDPGTPFVEFQSIAKAHNDLKETLENEVRARLRLTLELQKARSAADAAARAHDELLVRMQEQQAPGVLQAEEQAAARGVNLGAPDRKPRGSKRRRRNQDV